MGMLDGLTLTPESQAAWDQHLADIIDHGKYPPRGYTYEVVGGGFLDADDHLIAEAIDQLRKLAGKA